MTREKFSFILIVHRNFTQNVKSQDLTPFPLMVKSVDWHLIFFTSTFKEERTIKPLQMMSHLKKRFALSLSMRRLVFKQIFPSFLDLNSATKSFLEKNLFRLRVNNFLSF